MVERFNGRITEIVGQTRFGSAAELESTLRNYLKIYNNSIPQRASNTRRLSRHSKNGTIKSRNYSLNPYITKRVLTSTANSGAAQGVLGGINPLYLNDASRFGAAFYVAEQPMTTVAELAHHAVYAEYGIRFGFNSNVAKVLDLTDPAIAANWGYNGGMITPATKEIGVLAKKEGFNVIRFNSERISGGVNHAVLSEFNEILKPISISPVKK